MTWEWLGSTIASVAVTAVVTTLIVRALNRHNNHCPEDNPEADREHQVMLRKLDKLCECIPALATMPTLQQRQVELLGEIKGLLSR
jgi:hypothetical protein